MNRRDLLKKGGLFSALAALPFFKFLSPRKPTGWIAVYIHPPITFKDGTPYRHFTFYDANSDFYRYNQIQLEKVTAEEAARRDARLHSQRHNCPVEVFPVYR
jgi:hypothetical protein